MTDTTDAGLPTRELCAGCMATDDHDEPHYVDDWPHREGDTNIDGEHCGGCNPNNDSYAAMRASEAQNEADAIAGLPTVDDLRSKLWWAMWRWMHSTDEPAYSTLPEFDRLIAAARAEGEAAGRVKALRDAERRAFSMTQIDGNPMLSGDELGRMAAEAERPSAPEEGL